MTVSEQIVRRRKQCLVHRYLYYVQATTLIDDLTYDIWERDLRHLVEENPALAESLPYAEECPTKTVGSSNLDDYPRELQCVAESLLDWIQKHPHGYVPPDESFDDIIGAEQPGLFG